MATKRKTESEPTQTKRRPATTPEGRENQLINLAYDAVEAKIRNKTASSQEITHFLKLGSSREKLEQERLAKENELLEAKAEAMKSAKRVEELYATALDAMRAYAGQAIIEEGEIYD